MCDFLTVGLPANRAALLRAAVPRRLNLAETANPAINAHLPRDFATFVVTSHGCSCGLVDFYPSVTTDPAAMSESLRADYGKRGWSPAKVERAIAQATRPKPAGDRHVGLRPDLLEALLGVLPAAGELALVDHFYEGNFTTEAFAVATTYRVTADEFRTGRHPAGRDQLVFVRPEGRR